MRQRSHMYWRLNQNYSIYVTDWQERPQLAAWALHLLSYCFAYQPQISTFVKTVKLMRVAFTMWWHFCKASASAVAQWSSISDEGRARTVGSWDFLFLWFASTEASVIRDFTFTSSHWCIDAANEALCRSNCCTRRLSGSQYRIPAYIMNTCSKWVRFKNVYKWNILCPIFENLNILKACNKNEQR